MRILLPLALVAVFVVILWGLGRLLGFHVSLGWSLIGSAVLTLLLNAVLMLFRRR